MEEPEKPFPCSVEGCNMKFADVDHLAVHKKKHDMVLFLGNGQKTTFVADQTPTPTRFIRNCEEVGLFQDLQNVNPFEETFRKAVESGKTGFSALSEADSLHVPAGSDDTLHTPHVFPYIGDDYKSIISIVSNPTKDTKVKVETGEQSPDSQLASVVVIEDDRKEKIIKEKHNKTNDNSSSTQLVFHASLAENTNSVSTDASEMQLVLRMPDGKLLHFSSTSPSSQKPDPPLSNESQNNGTPTITVSEYNDKENSETDTEQPASKLSLVKLKLRQTLAQATRNSQFEKTSASRNNSSRKLTESPRKKEQKTKRQGAGDDKREKFLERNRVAAMRCREKRKNWIKELQRRGEDMKVLNQQLQTEVTSLRSEVAQLKTLLLAHKNCPVTHALQQGNTVTIDSASEVIQQLVTLPVSSTVPVCDPLSTMSIAETIPVTPSMDSTATVKVSRILPRPKVSPTEISSRTVKNITSQKRQAQEPHHVVAKQVCLDTGTGTSNLIIKNNNPFLQTVTLTPSAMNSIPTASIVGPIVRSSNGNVATITPGVLISNQSAAVLKPVNPQVISLSVVRQPAPLFLPNMCVAVKAPQNTVISTQRHRNIKQVAVSSVVNTQLRVDSSSMAEEGTTSAPNDSAYDSDIEILPDVVPKGAS